MKTKLLALISILLPALLVFTVAINTGSKLKEIQPNNQELIPTKTVEVAIPKDSRVVVLEEFFDKYKSPLKEHAVTFIETAEKYNIDYKLLPAISCVESTCGKFIPHESYNPFGWGVTSKGHISFNSFDEAIEKVGAGLNKGYFSKGFDTVHEIAPIYTPPNSTHWASSVNYFIFKLEEIEKEKEQEDIKNKVLTYL